MDAESRLLFSRFLNRVSIELRRPESTKTSMFITNTNNIVFPGFSLSSPLWDRFSYITATMRHTSSDECTVILVAGVKQYGAALKEEALRLAPYPGPDFEPQYSRKLGMAVE